MLIVGKMWGSSEAPELAENANILGRDSTRDVQLGKMGHVLFSVI
jgi:hypothetical protein